VTPRKTASAAAAEDEFLTSIHVYTPHRAGLPRFGPYVRELWARRGFAAELSRTTMRAAHTDTFFGRLWLVLNPLLLASVYYTLVTILSNSSRGMAYFAHLLAGLFAFYFVANAMQSGASSVVAGGRLVMNTAFPRLLLPLSAVRTAFFRFLPTLLVYGVVHLIAGLKLSPAHLMLIPALALIVVFSVGMAAFFATLNVYFRDTTSFLPYFTRIWLYVSPVLLTVPQIADAAARHDLSWLVYVNPLFPLLGTWSELITSAEVPSSAMWLAGVVWSFGTFALGSLFFMSREREFAVRL